MTQKDGGHFAKKHPVGATPDPRIAEKVKALAQGGGLGCTAAFEIVRTMSVSPQEVGRCADLLEMPVTKCQLGLFGYQPEKRVVKPDPVVAPQLREAIERHLVDNRLPCRAAFKISDDLQLPKMKVAAACEALKIRVSKCQLGAF
jgi:hypothetical protein